MKAEKRSKFDGIPRNTGRALPGRGLIAAAAVLALLGGCDGCDGDGGEDAGTSSTDTTTACTLGTEGCACDSGSCNTGLVCEDNICVEETVTAGFTVSDENARSCEILLSGTTAADSVNFADTLQGKSVREGELLAIAFHTVADAAIPAGSVEIARAGGDLSGVSISRASCFDGDGAPLAGANVSLSKPIVR